MRAVHCVVSIVVLILAIAAGVSACSAQVSFSTPQPLPDAPRTLGPVTVANASGEPPAHFLGTGSTKTEIVAPAPAAVRTRTADSSFFLMNGIYLGMAVFDVELTQRCIAAQRCRETNPLMPSSQAGQLSINLALVASTGGISYWLKKHRSRLWWLLPATGIAVHSVGVATGFEHQ